MKNIKWFIVILVLTSLPIVYSTEISVEKGPHYIKNNIARYLPDIKITFKYTDTTGEDFNKVRHTDSAGNIIGSPLPLSPGATVDGQEGVKSWDLNCE